MEVQKYPLIIFSASSDCIIFAQGSFTYATSMSKTVWELRVVYKGEGLALIYTTPHIFYVVVRLSRWI